MSLRAPLTVIAVALSGVTAASVGSAVFKLISDPVPAWMFAGAAVLLDAYKYMAWPRADALIKEQRPALASLMIGFSLLLAGVSGWAVYDRLDNAMAKRSAESKAVAEQRIRDLEAAREVDHARLRALAADADLVRRQAAALTDLTRISKAAELAAAGKAQVDKERGEILARLDASSLELTRLRSMPEPAKLPPLATLLLCLGFAFSLELVPVLIFMDVHKRRRESAAEAQVPASEPPPEPLYDAAPVHIPVEPEVPQLPPKPDPEPAPAADISADLPEPKEQIPEPTFPQMREPVLELEPQPEPSPEDRTLLQNLLDSLAGVEPGTSMPIKKFARAVGIGNTKAGAVFQAAEELGALTKTNRGYVVAERSA
ncbi:conserved membrane hypothetical protein [Pseudomonas sp. OF001]|nr:conserved membrane hypothetical protein [Pseudomonas sp. OF001]